MIYPCPSAAIRFTRPALALGLIFALLFFGPAPANAQDPSPDPAKLDGQPEAPAEVEVIPLFGPAAPPLAASPITAQAAAGVDLGEEVEPNNSAATAMALTGRHLKIKGNIFGNGDLDFYSFTATAGDRVYAATMTAFSASTSNDSVLDLFASDGTTILQSDDNDGSIGSSSSTIAGAAIPATGTYYLRVRHSSATSQLRPYNLYLSLQSGVPVAETEPNDSFPGQVLPASGWVSGATSSTADVDHYSLSLNAGDTVFLSLDLDPERDSTGWNGQLGLGRFNGNTLTVNDAGGTGFDSEAFFITVKNSGTYGVFVGTPSGGTTFGTYHLSVSVIPAPSSAACTTYTSTDVPVTIPTGPGQVSSTLTIPDNKRIASIKVFINLTHNFMADLDVHLISPAGNDNGLFSDIGSFTSGANTSMDIGLDDEAGVPISVFTVNVNGMIAQPESNYRLGWFKGENAAGTWTLTLHDDGADDGGTLNGWSIVICEEQAACAISGPPIFGADFEADDGGFTHSGTQDEWERGAPSFETITTCHSGASCWKTDLDNTYNSSSNQDLLSPNIDLTNVTGTINFSWAQRYQLESAQFDRAFVEVREAGNPANSQVAWQWLDGDMVDTVGNPTTTIQESAGWGLYRADISAFAGKTIQLRFHLDSDATVQRAGLAIDDVQIAPCDTPDLSLRKSASPVAAMPGQLISYTLTFSNTGLLTASNVVLTDTVPVSLTNLSVTSSGVVITNTGASPASVWRVQDLAPNQGGTITITGQISPNLSSESLFTNTATINAPGDLSAANNSDEAGVTVLIVPEMAVLGNGQEIADGDATPALADHTDFGNATLGQDLIRTFIISNSGVSNLTLTGSPLVTITGPAAADFSLVVSPTTPIATNSTTTFQVRFSPVVTGTRAATLTLANDDSDENPYDFAVQGVGVTTSAPPAGIIYLPLILRGSTPDLVVKEIIATTNRVQVVIQNQGGTIPVDPANEFWVDLYVNPVPPPSGVNQTCTSGGIVCEQFAIWGVTQSLLPQLTSGGVITLTIGDAYQTAGADPISLTSGSTVYAQVDSDNALTTYGAIAESNEGNNISSTLSTGAASVAADSASNDKPTVPSPYLPSRSQ